MKRNIVLSISALALVGLMSSCEKTINSNSPAEMASAEMSTVMPQQNVSADGLLSQQSALPTVNLGVAGDFAILSKTGITDVYKSAITGDIGSSPITGAAILVRCSEVVGTIYSVDAAGPLPSSVTNSTRLTTAVGDMQTAYTDAAGRVNPSFLNLGAGNIGGKTLTPGLYKWTSALIIPTDVTISGGPNDIFIFQVAGTLNMSSAVRITLIGGAQAKNIFWVASGAVTLGTTSHFEGNILGQTGINMQTGASINGRMLAQTAVTLQMNTVNKPE
ncbi:MAG TPA: ice-binding family protein [Williamwhitmania sp.]|nr:ice-binding family protein [Williamwhitmania sp.]